MSTEEVRVESAYWQELLEHSPLGILTDLDGTLLPFASTPEEAQPTPALRQLVHEVATLPGTTLAIVSGRPREVLESYFPPPREALLVAEHGGWRTGAKGWESPLSVDALAVDTLVAELRRVHAKYPAAIVERKTWSLAFHYRRVPPHRKAALLVQLSAVVDPWLAAHRDFEALLGAEVVEIRPRTARKSSAVAWIKERLGADARLIVLGDDRTDEDMFAALTDERDASVHIGGDADSTGARWRLASTAEAHAFLRAIVAVRSGGAAAPSVRPRALAPQAPARPSAAYRLLILSNRLPELRSAGALPNARQRNVGGLVSALRPVLEARKGIWLGWSGRTHAGGAPGAVAYAAVDGLSLASVDFPEEWHRLYYNGFSNGALWPLLHSFPARARFVQAEWLSYVRANEAFASIASDLVGKGDTIWAHDYHLFLLARFLRHLGHEGPLGLFQHIPFPGPDIFFLLPWADEILAALLAYDLVGFHTKGYVDNFVHCASRLPGVRIEGHTITFGGRVTRAAAFPLGIIPDDFQDAGDAAASEEIEGLVRAIGGSRMVLGVDRLDYTKGIPERIDAFGHLLALYPEWRKKVCLVQVSVPSRADIPDYAEQRSRVENSVGRINGEYGEADWVPIRYLYRSYGRSELSQLYRAAHVGYVTPLRDGMNLVAKEYVAAQNADDPGVLLLSRFAGAAEELTDALLTNPWYPEGTAQDLDRALRMPEGERKARHAALLATISKTTALTWAEDFLGALAVVRRP